VLRITQMFSHLLVRRGLKHRGPARTVQSWPMRSPNHRRYSQRHRKQRRLGPPPKGAGSPGRWSRFPKG
jgi:hypothetical protein